MAVAGRPTPALFTGERKHFGRGQRTTVNGQGRDPAPEKIAHRPRAIDAADREIRSRGTRVMQPAGEVVGVHAGTRIQHAVEPGAEDRAVPCRWSATTLSKWPRPRGGTARNITRTLYDLDHARSGSPARRFRIPKPFWVSTPDPADQLGSHRWKQSKKSEWKNRHAACGGIYGQPRRRRLACFFILHSSFYAI